MRLSRSTPFYLKSASVSHTLVFNKPVKVPSDFLGFHFHRWPVGTPLSNPPIVPYGSVRTHDGGLSWNKIDLGTYASPGPNYDWTHLDAVVATHVALGKTIVFTLYGTPSYCLLRPAERLVTDAYGAPGGGGAAQPALVAAFITALLTRYNTSGPRKIKAIEIWNEPDFSMKVLAGFFFWGSASELVSMGIAVRQARDAVDPGVEVLSPGFTSGVANMTAWLDASYNGVYGKDIVDGVCWHPYGASALEPGSVVYGQFGTLVVDRALAKRGMTGKKKYITEYGIAGSTNVANPKDILQIFLNAAPIVRYRRLARVLAIAAASGVQGYYIYSYDHTDKLCGDYYNDTQGVMQAVTDICNIVAGKTITRSEYLSDGSISLTINGVVYNF